jgi:hypothetical protein
VGQIYVCDECGQRVTEDDVYLFISNLNIFYDDGDIGHNNVILCSKRCSMKFIEKMWCANDEEDC